ncbi:SIMPL domain-containing protein [Neisseria perflava]|uniref:SIMPL domain-containing protein n=1 Tax=Neisseria perflava TaxID=33053 RepID=UPI00209D9BA7|nr:SIMPL domain-containing protein [Neisseria perflava]MCP1659449.1 putative secreted protein [Neisseria perflava]MCP1772288.1 putative secreted protein [Neisseria perflava]
MRTVLLTALLLTTTLPAAAEPLNYNIVEFSESAVLEVPRDTMTARFRIFAEGKERNAVSQAFAQKFNAFNRQAQGKAFKTELLSRSVQPRYQYNNGKRTQTGWEESASFKVESQDFAALNRLIAQTQNEANVEYTAFSVSKAKREAAVDEVSKAAIVRFKDRAQTITRTLGFSGYKIVKLNLGHIGSRTIESNAVQMKMLRAAAPMAANMQADTVDTASPGTEEISITVDGTIQM